MSRQTAHARRLADRRRKRDRALRDVTAFLAAHPGPSSGEAFAEYGRLFREQVEIRAELYRASWEQVFRRMERSALARSPGGV